MRRLLTMLALLTIAVECRAEPPRSPAPSSAAVYIISPADGEVVHGPVTVKFGLEGMGVAPAGVAAPDTGHHHLLIDVEALPPLDQPLPANEHIRHFGGGQTQTTLRLAPGTHTLQLVLGDANHVPHDPPLVSAPIRIRVVEE
jgi:hypothetical protein